MAYLKNFTGSQDKAGSVRRLFRTSLPIPYAAGIYEAKAPARILAGLLTLESKWSPTLGDSLVAALGKGVGDRKLDLGCVATDGTFSCDDEMRCTFKKSDRAATAFLLDLIGRLQMLATVPMIDIAAYARWLEP